MRMPTPIRRRVSSRETDTTGRTVRRAVWFEVMRLFSLSENAAGVKPV
jgi:hypothetical protein